MSRGSGLARCTLAALAATAAIALLTAPAPAGAQPLDDDEVRQVDVSYEVGAFDSARGDWPIVAVEVRGDLDPQQPVTVELWGAGEQLWMGTVRVTAPVTRLEVTPFVAVGDLVEVGIWQELTQVAGVQIERPQETVLPPDVPEDDPVEEAEEEIAPAGPEVGGIEMGGNRAEVLRSGPGGGGSGQLALSMILAVTIVAIIFRSPLPSASSQRWTR
jgi:hypothetical protein